MTESKGPSVPLDDVLDLLEKRAQIEAPNAAAALRWAGRLAVARWDSCCSDGPLGHTRQEHHDASPCYDGAVCPFDHPKGGPYPHPCDDTRGSQRQSEARP